MPPYTKNRSPSGLPTQLMAELETIYSDGAITRYELEDIPPLGARREAAGRRVNGDVTIDV